MILLDNTVLSNFALADEIHLLKEFCRGTGATTVKVVAEFDAGVTRGLFKLPDFSWLKILDFENEIEKSMFARLNQRIGAGEASCLTMAILRKYDFLSDDMMVRKMAYREGVRISGSIGVLIALVKMDRITLGTEIIFCRASSGVDIFLQQINWMNFCNLFQDPPVELFPSLEIVEDLEAALAQFKEISDDLGAV